VERKYFPRSLRHRSRKLHAIDSCRRMAPELWEPEGDQKTKPPQLTMATDVWAFGMTVLEVRDYPHFKTEIVLTCQDHDGQETILQFTA
jgi:hypothetical protein